VTALLRQLAGDTAVYGLLDVFNRLVLVFLVPLYARVLSPAEYGAVDLATTLVTVLYAVVTVGMDSAATQFFHQAAGEGRRAVIGTAVVVVVATSTLAAFVLIAMRSWLAPVVLRGAADADRLLLLAAVSLPLMVTAAFMTLVLRIRFQRGAFVVVSVTMLLTNVGANFAFVAFLGHGPAGVFMAQVISSVIGCVLGAWLARDVVFSAPSAQVAKRMTRYGAPLVVPNVAYWFSMYAERYAIATMAGLAAVGIFGIAAKIAAAVTIVSSAIDYAWMPFALSIQTREDAPQTYAHVLTYYVALCGFAGATLTIFAREILVLVADRPFHDASIVVGPVVAALLARGAINILAIGSFVTGRTGGLAGISVASVFVHLAALAVLTPPWGALGAATATLAARCFSAAAIHRASRRNLRVPYHWGVVTRSAIVFVAAAAVAIPLSDLSLPVALAVKALVVVPAMAIALVALTGLHRDEMLRELWRRSRGSTATPRAD
jgi:O-antigen/teichoic acid export membrane protein